MIPYKAGSLTPVQQQPGSLSSHDSHDSMSETRSYSQSPVNWELDQMHSPVSFDGQIETANYCQSTIGWDIDRTQRFRQYCSSSLGYEFDMNGALSQVNWSPINAEMEKFFPFPTMSITFMPCVCVPDYTAEEGKPRKICRRCSVAQLTSTSQSDR